MLVVAQPADDFQRIGGFEDILHIHRGRLRHHFERANELERRSASRIEAEQRHVRRGDVGVGVAWPELRI